MGLKRKVLILFFVLASVTTIPAVHCPLLRGEPLPDPVDGFSGDDAKALQTTTTSSMSPFFLFLPFFKDD